MKIPIIPNEFKARYAKILGKENNEFLRYCCLPLRKCIRINTLKVKNKKEFVKELREKWDIEKVPFCDYAYFVNENIELGKTEEYFFGKIYIQEASSLLPPIVLKPSQRDFVLDSCAAPGSKTTQLAQIMNNKGCIVANDINFGRIKSLRFNIEICGVLNTAVTRMGAIKFEKFPERFDKILVDVPCSCEGVIRKNWNVLSRWSPKAIKYISYQQKKILKSCLIALKKQGILVYSTCTLAPEENEEVIDYALKNFDLEIEKIKIQNLKMREGILEWEGKKFDERVSDTIRIYPHENNTEGFFIAKLRKL
ncbi:MAG: tRNA methyltransferase [Candidatus Aenigmarchaeota archaeon ex4484_56]|nr:MAG: tRNA methyltransferase [Candidatus Aenigmarchaeota archaeon ex4484_56]